MDDKLLLEIPQGKLLGREYISAFNGAKYYCFLGIPYAQPPVDNLRFMPPEPAGKWRGIRNARKPGNDCMHKVTFDTVVVGAEDCLYLNVFTPGPPCDIKKPKAVIVIVHCGGMAWGSGSPDYFGVPDFVVHHDVVFVAFNFRLHVFGFLNLELPNCSGNMGMKDMVMAFRWIRENIQYFGGDPNNITAFGNSSGASAIHLMMISPISRGIFHKAILQGGYALNTLWSYQTDHLEMALRLGRILGFKGNHTKRLLRFLKQLPAVQIVEALGDLRKELKEKSVGRIYNSIFMTSVEAIAEGAFMPQSPRELLFTNDPIPIIWNIANLEGIHGLHGSPWDVPLVDIIRDQLWMYKISPQVMDVIVEKVKTFYFGKRNHGRTTIPQLVDLYSDLWYTEWADVLHFQTTLPNPCPLYVYSFKFVGKFNFQRNFFTKGSMVECPDGAAHGDDSPYFIYYKIHSEVLGISGDFPEMETKVINNMVAINVNFAKTGNPNGGLSEDIEWKPYDPNDPEYLDFGETLKIKKGIIHEGRVKFWRELVKYIKENENVDTGIQNGIKNLRINKK